MVRGFLLAVPAPVPVGRRRFAGETRLWSVALLRVLATAAAILVLFRAP